jgi:hypothetical protein
MTVGRLQRDITSAEWSAWLALGRIEPRGQDRDDYRLAALRQTIAIGYSDPKRKTPKVEQYLLRWKTSIGKRGAVRQSAESIMRCLTSITKRFGTFINPREDSQ